MNDKNNRVKDALQSIALGNVPNDTNLWPRIASQLGERNSLMQTLRARPVLLALVLFLLLAFLSGAVYALGRILGFVPGVGIVDQSMPLRVLSEPVVVERDGLTVTVSEMVVDSKHTFVAYAWEGIIPVPGEGFLVCGALPSLRLPNGSTLEILGGGAGGFGGEIGLPARFETTVDYPPIPAGIDQVTFVLDCILPEGTGPENWRIPLALVPAPKGFATPAAEVGATFVAEGPKFDTAPTPTFETELTPFAYDPAVPTTPTSMPNGSGLYLEQVIALPDSYILVGNFTDAGDLPGHLLATGSAYDYVPRIEDADGNPVVFKIRDDIKPVIALASVHYWAYEIAKPVQGSVKITLDEIDIDTVSTVHFDFDTGSNPQPGQTWDLNLPIHLGRYDYVVDSVEMIESGYNFRFHSGVEAPEGTSFILDILGSSQEHGPGSGVEDRRPKNLVKYSQSITYLDSPPTGTLIVELTLFESIPLQGPWKLTWTPPNK